MGENIVNVKIFNKNVMQGSDQDQSEKDVNKEKDDKDNTLKCGAPDKNSSRLTNDNSCPTLDQKVSRRDFLSLTAGSLIAGGGICALYPLMSSFAPSADVLSTSSIDVDISDIKEGQTLVIKWRGKPVFITHRTKKQIDEARKGDLESMPDPELDSARVKVNHQQWLVTIGICTHLGCIPLANQGDFDGWFCPCHGSQYDSSGRVRKGPAPLNLAVPPYEFISNNKIRIG